METRNQRVLAWYSCVFCRGREMEHLDCWPGFLTKISIGTEYEKKSV